MHRAAARFWTSNAVPATRNPFSLCANTSTANVTKAVEVKDGGPPCCFLGAIGGRSSLGFAEFSKLADAHDAAGQDGANFQFAAHALYDFA